MPHQKWQQIVSENLANLSGDVRKKLHDLNGAENDDDLTQRLMKRFSNLSPDEFLNQNPDFFNKDSITGPHGKFDGEPMYHDTPTHDKTPSNGGPGWSRSM
jgi:hypothetical protein